MNNEPVAWMYERPNGSAKLTFVREPMAGTVVTETPLYTHPVNRIAELEQQLKEEIQARADALDDLNNRMMKFMKSYNEMAWKLEEVGGAYIHPAKTLTDEEIEEVARALIDDCSYCSLHFARAILRKAQEK
jgi:hypothetical protein